MVNQKRIMPSMSRGEPAQRCMYVDLSNFFGGTSTLFDDGIYIDFATLMPIFDDVFGGIDKFKVYGSYRGINEVTRRNRDKVQAQNEFMNSARIHGVHFGKGYIRNRQEKHVDMLLGVDMVNDAHNGEFTDFILLSGDADYQYPVSIVKSLNKYFHYCAFATRYSAQFAFSARKKLLIDYNKYFIKNTDRKLIPKQDFKIVDVYKDKRVTIKSIKEAKTPRSSRGASN